MNKHIQIRNVPDELHRRLKKRAAEQGLSLSDYLREEMRRLAALPSREEWVRRVRSRPSWGLTVDEIVQNIHEAREERTDDIMRAVDDALWQPQTVIVIDCSALFAFLSSPAEFMDFGETIRSQTQIAAPDFIDLELLHTLRKSERLKKVDSAGASTILADFQDMRLERYASQELVLDIWKLRHNFTAYDAAYVALAERLSAPLLTADLRLKRAVAEHTSIKLI